MKQIDNFINSLPFSYESATLFDPKKLAENKNPSEELTTGEKSNAVAIKTLDTIKQVTSPNTDHVINKINSPKKISLNKFFHILKTFKKSELIINK